MQSYTNIIEVVVFRWYNPISWRI